MYIQTHAFVIVNILAVEVKRDRTPLFIARDGERHLEAIETQTLEPHWSAVVHITAFKAIRIHHQPILGRINLHLRISPEEGSLIFPATKQIGGAGRRMKLLSGSRG